MVCKKTSSLTLGWCGPFLTIKHIPVDITYLSTLFLFLWRILAHAHILFVHIFVDKHLNYFHIFCSYEFCLYDCVRANALILSPLDEYPNEVLLIDHVDVLILIYEVSPYWF